MRLYRKYKQLLKFNTLFKFCAAKYYKRLIKFKRSKWKKNFRIRFLKKLRKLFKKQKKARFFYRQLNKKRDTKSRDDVLKRFNYKPRKLNPRYKFFKRSNFRLNFLKPRKMIKYKQRKKQSLILLRSLRFFFDNNVKLSFFKNNDFLFKKSSFVNFFALPFFDLKIFLWKIGLFKSSYLAEQYILQNKIKLNNNIIKNSVLLKQGDIVLLSYDLIKEYRKKNL